MAIPAPPPGFREVPAPPPGFREVDPPKLGQDIPAPPKGFRAVSKLEATGRASDGDTIALTDGRNARLLGYDAFETNQRGRARSNALVDLSSPGRDMLADFLPGAAVNATGDETYGRPVVTVDQDGQDPGAKILREGWGLAVPEYLDADPSRRQTYMEAERLARLNRLGAHGGKFETPAQFRHKDGPFKAAEPGVFGKGEAVFWDEPTPFQGLRPEIKAGYEAVLADPKSTKGDILAFANQSGFIIDPDEVDFFLKKRAQPNTKIGPVTYKDAPQVMTDLGDGALGAGARGFADPINMLDELGGVVDTLGGTGGRENVWNSDRRFGDVLWNNIDQNRDILRFDDANHPYARFGGQFASGAVLPGGSIQGVGLAAGRAALLKGATMAEARLAARAAISRRLGMVGGAYGGAAGAGAGEGGIVDRLPGAAIGAAAGAVLGYGTGELGQTVAGAVNRLRGRARVPVADGSEQSGAFNPLDGAPRVGDPEQAAPTDANMVGTPPARGVAPANIGQDGRVYIGDPGTSHFSVTEKYPDVQFGGGTGFVTPEGRFLDRSQALDYVNANGENVRPSSNMPGDLDALDYRDQVANRRANMDTEGIDDLSISAPVRDVDRIDIGEIPPPPPGYTLIDPPFSRARADMQRASAEEMAEAARRVNPEDVTPLPNNAVESLDEATAIGDGMRPLLRPEDEFRDLGTRYTPSTRDTTRQLPHKGPLDLVSFLRTQGGLKPEGSDLASMGIDNAPRGLDFAQGESRMGKLVDPVNGMTLDEAADAAWKAGYLPDFNERPTINEFLDVLGGTHSGSNRAFHPDDLPEVDRFYAQRDQRYRIMQADQEGAPLADDLGQPISLDDLDANKPPATAYEDLPKAGGKVANINLANIETRHDIRRVLQATETRFDGFDAARRGRVTQAETEALAAEMGMTVEGLLKRRVGQALNAEEALAARQLLAKSADEVIALAKKVRPGGDARASDAERAAFQQAMLRHAAIQEQVTGATAEAGRALAQFKIAAKSRVVGQRLHRAIVDGAGGEYKLDDIAQGIIDLQKQDVPPGAINAYAVKALKPKFSDKLVELWYNSLLSGPQTHAVNVLSNAITAGLQIPEHVAASLLGQFRRRSFDRVLASEIGPRFVGLLQGTREGVKAFARTLKTGEVPDFVTKVESRSQKAISGIKGSIIRTPSRFLAAEDELFKAIGRRMDIAGQAVRKANAEGLRGDAKRARIEELTANPTDQMIESSLDYARYLTYQRPLGEVGQSVSRITQAAPVLKLFIPFVRTPLNIFKFVGERSPAAIFMKSWRNDIRAKGARRDLAIAKAALGTGLGMTIMQLAQDGHITGSGPMDKGAASIMRADGWQPYSIRIGDKFYSYQRLDPIASTLGVAADLAGKSEYLTNAQQQKSIGLLVASIMKNLSDKTWLSGVSDALEAVNDPDRYAERWLARMAGSIAVPSLVNQIARVTDPVLREAREPIDAIKNRIPGLSQSLPARRDIWGKEITREDSVGPDIASPIWTGTAKGDPINREMLEVGARINWIRPQTDPKPTDAQFSQFKALAGSIAEAELRNSMARPDWDRMSKDERRDEIDGIKRDASKQAKAALFGGYAKKSAAIPPPPPGFTLVD